VTRFDSLTGRGVCPSRSAASALRRVGINIRPIEGAESPMARKSGFVGWLWGTGTRPELQGWLKRETARTE